MKLLVFAHKPPPHHGQSYMVQLLLEKLGGDRRGTCSSSGPRPPIECYHVDCRFSERMDEIGRLRWQKPFRLLGYCAEAIWCRFRYGVRNFLYVPAPGMRSALYRDWIMMALCRPFFRHWIYYWQAAGLAEWLRTHAKPWERWITRRLLPRPDLSIVLGDFNRTDGVEFGSRRVVCVPNAVPDPCPGFAQEVLPRRQARAITRRELLSQIRPPSGAPIADDDPCYFRLLFLSLCTREKGLFDLLDATALLQEKLRGTPLKVRLTVAGGFWMESERKEFEQRIQQPDLNDGEPLVEYRGFVHGLEKAKLFRDSDCLCLPTYYPAESFPVVLVEAMAFGLPVVATHWRMLPELFPAGYTGLVSPRSPAEIAAAAMGWLKREDDAGLRRHFLDHYTDERFASRMIEALLPLESVCGFPDLEKQGNQPRPV